MRIDDYLSTVRIIKRRTIAKEMAEGGRVKLNGKSVKPAHPVGVGDYIRVSFGAVEVDIEVLEIPTKSVRKEDCEIYYRRLK